MSTKAITEALDWLENYLGSNDEAQDARRRARAEVEAIEKAMTVLNNCQIGYSRGVTSTADAEAAYTLIHSIAAQRNAGTAGAAGPKDGA